MRLAGLSHEISAASAFLQAKLVAMDMASFNTMIKDAVDAATGFSAGKFACIVLSFVWFCFALFCVVCVAVFSILYCVVRCFPWLCVVLFSLFVLHCFVFCIVLLLCVALPCFGVVLFCVV